VVRHLIAAIPRHSDYLHRQSGYAFGLTPSPELPVGHASSRQRGSPDSRGTEPFPPRVRHYRVMKCLGRTTALGVLALASTGMTGGQAAATSPGLIPAAHLNGAQCLVSGTGVIPSHSGTTPPTLSAHPSGVEIVWLPGLYSKTCKAVLTRGNAHIASALASAIDEAPVVKPGPPFSCNIQDDRTSARLYFTYAHRSTKRIDDHLSECGSITDSGDGGASRSPTDQFLRNMTTLAPAAWRRYVGAVP
jgi:hypothetical protein